jgi:hypothetical protein
MKFGVYMNVTDRMRLCRGAKRRESSREPRLTSMEALVSRFMTDLKEAC